MIIVVGKARNGECRQKRASATFRLSWVPIWFSELLKVIAAKKKCKFSQIARIMQLLKGAYK